ncbi:TIGR03619 family F420-dependent LLM class oxidoreductase [Nocardioides sp. BGMRC 2183]|nr:TIGR03619 family F420-dependent LLM class oxidoreductase [Nocardioides sp. BGMRC 2183]
MRWWMSAAMVAPGDLPELVLAAEETGFTGVTLPDSVLYPEQVSAQYPYSPGGARRWAPDTAMPDPLVAIAALAAQTSRIRFQPTVLKVPLRDPLLLAKQVATLAVLSGDRVDLGVGVSWMPEEFQFTGTDMRTRGARLTEAISILRAVCGGGPHWVEHHGRHYDFDPLMISPAPSTPVPIRVGGHSDAALRRAARHGDGWISANLDVADLEVLVRRVHDLRAECGRTSARFSVFVSPQDRPDADGFERLEDAGATDVYLSPWGHFGDRGADRSGRLRAVRRFAAEVIGTL